MDAATIPVDAIVDWCIDRMGIYSVKKITMDNYRYSLFREIFEREGIPIETRDNPSGIIRLIRRSRSAGDIIAPVIEKLFAEGKIDYGPSAIMRWYTNNTKIKVDGFGNHQFEKIEPIRRKTDGFMAFTAAMFSSDLLRERVIYV